MWLLLTVYPLIGPLPFDYPPNILDCTILVRTNSLNLESVRHSKIVLLELNNLPGLEFERFCIRELVNLKIVDWADQGYPNVVNIPCFKFGKNGNWQYFDEDTFLCSGTFARTLVSIIFIEYYNDSYESYERDCWNWWAKFHNTKDADKFIPMEPIFHKWLVLPKYYKFDRTVGNIVHYAN